MTDAEKLAPFLKDLCTAFDESGLQSVGMTRAIFAGGGFRESGFTWAKGYTPQGDPKGTGDGGHGHGLYQIDDRTWGDWLAKAHWWEPLVNMRKACDILRGNRGYFKALPTMPGTDANTLLRLCLASFNCGPTRALRGLRQGDPDKYTFALPGRTPDYSKWILAKGADLAVQIPELR